MLLFSRLIFFNILHVFGSWRWLAIVILFGITTAYTASNMSYVRSDATARHNINVWDVAANMVTSGFTLRWVYIFGFLILIGDSFLRERQQGLIALCLNRVSSRYKWWWGKISSIGVLALGYVTIGLLIILVVSSFLVPFSLSESLDAQSGQRMPDADWYFLIGDKASGTHWPTPLLVIVGTLYTAMSLWIVGSLILIISILLQNALATMGVTMFWLLLGLLIPPALYKAQPYISFIDIGYFVTFAKHSYQLYNVSFPVYLFIASVIQGLLVFLGFWKLKRLDL